jgi:hypothetical protein
MSSEKICKIWPNRSKSSASSDFIKITNTFWSRELSRKTPQMGGVICIQTPFLSLPWRSPNWTWLLWTDRQTTSQPYLFLHIRKDQILGIKIFFKLRSNLFAHKISTSACSCTCTERYEGRKCQIFFRNLWMDQGSFWKATFGELRGWFLFANWTVFDDISYALSLRNSQGRHTRKQF